MYDKIIKLPTDINNNAAEIGADWKNKLVRIFELKLKSFLEISFILTDLNALIKTITRPINWATIVAMAIPDIPRAGTGPKPYINKGFNNIFKKKLKIRTFL